MERVTLIIRRLEELEQNLLLQQLDEIIEAFESKEGVRDAVTMKSGQHGIPIIP